MKKKMRNNIIKKSFVALFAVSVLSTSISIAAFAEEDSTLEAPEESVVEEAAPAAEDVTADTVLEEDINSDIESPQVVQSDFIVEYPTIESTGPDQADIIISSDELPDFDIEDDKIYADNEDDNIYNPTYPEYTITIKYIDISSDSPIKEFSYGSSEPYICIDIPETLIGGNSTYSYDSNIYVRTNYDEFSDQYYRDFFFHELLGDVDVYIYYSKVLDEENDAPTVDPEIPTEPTEPTEDTVEPEEPSVDPVIPAEPVAPAPVVPEVPVAPIIIVEATPIVEETESFPPMVEATEIVAAPAYVLPTLLKADKEIIIDIPDEEIPLANIELNKTKTPMGHMHTDPHLCNILSLLLLIALAFVVYSYTQMAKKHDERIYELRLGNKCKR